MPPPTFIPGLELSRLFFIESVQPILAAHIDAPYSAGLLGAGSEVLGFDTPLSRDHDWGPRVTLYLPSDTTSAQRERLLARLEAGLPENFRGYPVMWQISGPSAYPCVELTTIPAWFQRYLGTDLQADLTPADWLTFPQQKLDTIASGGLFHDALGLQALRQRLAWYPHDLWLYLLACGWQRIGQEEHLMGRAGHAAAGDAESAQTGGELGSALIASRLVRDVMRLGFLMEKVYAPYAKWFGAAFTRLDCAAALMPHLQAALAAPAWAERGQCLAKAYELLAVQHNALGLTAPLDTQARSFFDRPFQVIDAERFAQSLVEQIRDPAVQRLASHGLLGSVDLFSDSTDLLNHARELRGLYQ